VTFETELDQPGALARLKQAGTLVVMPSLQENSPNTVYECLEHGIPFIASNVGGVPELIAPEDHARVLFEPTVEGLTDALQRVLETRAVPPPAQPAFDASISSERWAEVLSLQPEQSSTSTAGDFAVFLDEADLPDRELVPTLLRLQQATDADVVTCGVAVDGTLRFFPGEAGGLAAIENVYGTAGIVRRSLLDEIGDPVPAPRDRAWPFFARLAASGARIVSLPAALVEGRTPPGSVHDDPVGALLALQELERVLPDASQGAARLAAGLAAGHG
jgi:hypothetical protein